MKYFLKSLKYFFTFNLLTFLFVCFFVLTSNGSMTIAQALNPETGLWRGNNLYLIEIFFIFIAALYPSLMNMKREIFLSGTYAENADMIKDAFEEMGYVQVEDDEDAVVFRKSSTFVRIMRCFEDQITVHKNESSIVLHGLRKDVMRIASVISFRTSKKDEQ